MEKSQSRSEKFDTFRINTRGEWSTDELEKFLGSVKTIHDVYVILDMAKSHAIHDKTFDVVLSQLSRLKAVMNAVDMKDILHNLSSLYQIQGKDAMLSIIKPLEKQFFEVFSDFANDEERLYIDSIQMESPGGITFKRRVKRFPTESKRQDERTSLTKIADTVRNIIYLGRDREKGAREIQKTMMIENRSVDPRLLELANQILFDGPINTITGLGSKVDVQPTRSSWYEHKT